MHVHTDFCCLFKQNWRQSTADILEATYPAVTKRLHRDWIQDPAIPIVTGFLGKVFSFHLWSNSLIHCDCHHLQGWKSGAVSTLGRGGSDLTATTFGKALGLREIQVWKDVNGVLTCDPNIYPNAKTVPSLTFEEAAELSYFGAQVLHPQSMRPAREGDISVRVKNHTTLKLQAPLSLNKERWVVLTSIVVKSNVTMLDIVSTWMLGQFGFLAKELDHVVEELEKIAVVHLLQQRAITLLIGNVRRSSLILEKAFHVLRKSGVNVQMISQGASKANMSLIVHDSEAKQCIKALHQAFFEDDVLTEIDAGGLHMS